MNNKTLTSILVTALVVSALFWVLQPNTTTSVTKVVRNGEPTVGAITGPDVYSYMNVYGAFQQGGCETTVTPTSGAVTIAASEMRDCNIITFTASSTQAALTATLPATTTFPLGENAGAYRSWMIENPFTAAATTTTIAAGTGVDLQEPDGQNVVIGINNYAWLTCVRESSSDIVCRIDESIPAD